MTEKNKIILSSLFLTLLVSLVVVAFIDERDDMARIDDRGMESIGRVIKVGNRYKGREVIVYEYFVDGHRFEDSRRSNLDTVINVGDRVYIEYEADNPSNSRLIQTKPYFDNPSRVVAPRLIE